MFASKSCRCIRFRQLSRPSEAAYWLTMSAPHPHWRSDQSDSQPDKHSLRSTPDCASSPRSPVNFGVSLEGCQVSRGLADTSTIAISPPGVFTRYCQLLGEDASGAACSSSQRNSASQGSGKFDCSICKRKTACFCQFCAALKVRLKEKREEQGNVSRTKKKYAREIFEELKKQIRIAVELQNLNESIAKLKLQIEEKKNVISDKKQDVSRTENEIARHRKNIEELNTWCAQHEKALSKMSQPEKRSELEETQARLFAQQRDFSMQLFTKIFPIREVSSVDAGEMEKTRHIQQQCLEAAGTANDDSNWTMVVAPSVEPLPKTNTHFCVCGCFVKDYKFHGLRNWLKSGLPPSSSARSLHSAFAAFTYSIQLIGLLPVFFDVYLPYQVALKDVALCDKWTESLFDTDIFKMNLSVLLLCLDRGINSAVLDLHEPFSNLLYLYNDLSCSDRPKQVPPSLLTDKLAQMIEEDLKKLTWAERERELEPKINAEDDWCMVNSIPPNL